MAAERDLSLILGVEGCHDYYSPAEIKAFFNNGAHHWSSLVNESYGGIFWRQDESCELAYNPGAIQQKFLLVLKEIIEYDYIFYCDYFVVQFWVPKAIGGRFCLTTSDQPFAFGRRPYKGLCWYREHCTGHDYFVGDGVEEDEVGPIGRVFRNGHPELSPDILLYSTKEHPLRNHAARCGLRECIVLPVFDLLRSRCLGVLECLTMGQFNVDHDFEALSGALKAANLRSTHVGFCPTNKDPKYKQPQQNEIGEMLELAIDVVPQLCLAQVWVPCKQCSSMNNTLCCMERMALISYGTIKTNTLQFLDFGMSAFLEASEFQNAQRQKGIVGIVMSSTRRLCFCQNLCDLRITEYPLAHYAQQARLSVSFAICLQLKNENDLCVVEFFLQSHDRVNGYPVSILKVLLQIMESKLQSFEVAVGNLGEESIVEVMSPLGYEIIPQFLEKEYQSSREFTMTSLTVGSNENFLHFNLEEWLQNVDLYVKEVVPEEKGLVFCCPEREELLEYQSNNSSSPCLSQRNIKFLLKKIVSEGNWGSNYLIQYWAVKRMEDKTFLTTLDQPFAVAHLSEGLYEYRKQCMDHQYFVNEGANEKELGPLGRVFRNRCPETTPDLRLYSTKEFALRDYIARCGLRYYLALPIFSLIQEQCVAVLEIAGYDKINHLQTLQDIQTSLQEENLNTTHIKAQPLASYKGGQKSAFDEISGLFELATKTSQLFLAQAWAPCNQCADVNKNLRCMQRALSIHNEIFDWDLSEFRKVKTKRGLLGTVLASENKSCFCPNLCDFSISEQPEAHHAQQARLDVCFAICLQSSYNENIPYVLEFFLDKSSNKCQHLYSFLNFLLPTMKEKLKSFKVASGKQLGEELVVEVITSGKNKDFSSFESHQSDMLPIKFKITQYNQEMECRPRNDQVAHDISDDFVFGKDVAEEEEDVTDIDLDERTITIEKSKRERNEMRFRISYDDLKQHFGKPLKVVEKELGVSRSTIKRASRDFNIVRWPYNERNKKNPPLFETSMKSKCTRGTKQKNLAVGNSSNPLPLDWPLQQNMSHTTAMESDQILTELSEAKFAVIKATFGDDIVKIMLCLSSKLKKLNEEVARRFKLQIGSFKMKYLDEEDQLILLACNEDLQLCMKTLTALGKTPIQVLVQLVHN